MAHPHLKYLIVFTIALSDTLADNRSNVYARYGTTNLAFVGVPRIRDKHLQKDVVLQAAERRYSSDLDTAYEWLANDRLGNEQSCGGKFKWFDPDINLAEDKDEMKNDDGILDVKRMPLYPLGAVHIPYSGENHTLINIEPKNVKMGQDLVDGLWEDNLFCTSLRAKDTNRIAFVGTIMQLIDTEDRSINEAKTWPGKLLTHNRVVVNCKPVGIADIISIEGNEYGDDDYLIANVRVHALPKEVHEDGNESQEASTKNSMGNEKLNSIAQQLVEDYQQVRSIYINSKSLASNELPKYAQNAVQTLPTFDHEIVYNERKFWKVIETWQMLCNTIRQSKRTRLQSIVNELSVSVAMQAKGPLELPVKRKSLPLEVQTQLKNLEESAAKDFIELGMEPVLDFQELITMRNHMDRVEKLGGMIQRERLRLEAKESLIRAFFDEELLGEELTTGKMNDDNNIFD